MKVEVSKLFTKALLKLKKYKLLFILLPYFVFLIIGIYFAYERCKPVFIKNGARYTRNLCGKTKSADAIIKLKRTNDKKVNAEVFTDTVVNNWEIVDTSKSPHFPTGLKFSENDLQNPTVIRWNNFLIGINIEKYYAISSGAFFDSKASEHYSWHSQIRTLRIYDLDTRETFDISLDNPIWGEVWHVTNQVVDDIYYFGVGGAFGASIKYKLELPPRRNSRITTLPSGIGNSIEKYGNTYVSSFCYEGCTYSLFNPFSGTISDLDRMTKASNIRNSSRKEEFIGIDSQGRVILNVKKIPEDTKSQQRFDTDFLAASPLNNESSTTVLIYSSDLPETINRYFMIDGIDKVLLIGDSNVYIYDIVINEVRQLQESAQKIAFVDFINKSPVFISPTIANNIICFTDTKTVSYAINLVTDDFLSSQPKDCKTLYPLKSKKSVFDEFDLPDNFIFAPIQYKTRKVL